jgi:hypothetical protein
MAAADAHNAPTAVPPDTGGGLLLSKVAKLLRRALQKRPTRKATRVKVGWVRLCLSPRHAITHAASETLAGALRCRRGGMWMCPWQRSARAARNTAAVKHAHCPPPPPPPPHATHAHAHVHVNTQAESKVLGKLQRDQSPITPEQVTHAVDLILQHKRCERV